MKSDDKTHHVVIVGGGFGGLNTARSLKPKNIKVTLIDKLNYHLFQPLLYQVATGALSPADISSPLRHILKRNKNSQVLMGEVIDIDPENKEVTLENDRKIGYDFLVIATGSSHHYFGHDEWENSAPGLKSLEDATRIRSKILSAFEKAENETDPDEIQKLLTFVIVGGGPTGVELAGALAEIAKDTLPSDFRSINTAKTRIYLVEGLDRILTTYPHSLSQKAQKSLEQMGVTVKTNSMLTNIADGYVVLKSGENEDKIYTDNILWAAGVKASSLNKNIAQATGAKTDKVGRLFVKPDMSLENHPEIYIIGDLAHYAHNGGSPLPGVASVAMQQGKYIASTIKRKLSGKPVKDFKYRDFGSMATIGRKAAVAELKHLKISGPLAWLLWLFVHLMYIVEFENRILVLIQWAWNYITRNRSARLITYHKCSDN